jgi:hypothetical protein
VIFHSESGQESHEDIEHTQQLHMKTFFLGAIVSAAILVAQHAPAELIVYKGTAKVTYIGHNHNVQASFKLFFIVDHDTAKVAELLYANINGQKLYSTDTETNLHIVEVSGANGKVYTALTRPLSQCDTNDGTTSEDVFLEGVTTTLAVETNGSIYFPKTLTSVGQGYDPSAPPSLVNGTITATFDQKDTQTSNSADDDLDVVLARLVTYVQSLGYTEAPQTTRKTGGLAAQAARFVAPARPAP